MSDAGICARVGLKSVVLVNQLARIAEVNPEVAHQVAERGNRRQYSDPPRICMRMLLAMRNGLMQSSLVPAVQYELKNKNLIEKAHKARLGYGSYKAVRGTQ